MTSEEKAFEIITEICMGNYSSFEYKNPMGIAFEIMKHHQFPMHDYSHHYLVPAVLLTAFRKKEPVGSDSFTEELETIKKRSHSVLPAYCGSHGACGAAVGVGIFFSVITKTTPLSKKTWSLCNSATAGSLKEMADIGGPRCCKRNSFVAIRYAAKKIQEEFGCDLSCPEETECSFSKYNLECLKKDCPFYKENEADK
jgi:hypothetical protein